VFKDDKIPRKKPEWGVKNSAGELWKDRRGITWLDPHNRTAWEYIFEISSRCIELGFEEIQFDYIRYPSDGNVRDCRYSIKHTTTAAVNSLNEFLREANNRIKIQHGVNISIDVFGLTTSVNHDMGIGQRMGEMTQYVDFICPMVYPSHYAKGEYGIPEPNKEPYKVVFIAMKDAVTRLGLDAKKIRPYLQDFTMGYKYGLKEVTAQVQAAYDNGIYEWTLWNARAVYTYDVFKIDKFYNIPEELEFKISTDTRRGELARPQEESELALPLLQDTTK
jgi:hypothetical protein